MKGRIVLAEVIVSTVIATIIYVMFAVAYISMLALTERSAARYVRATSERRAPHTDRVSASPATVRRADSTENPAAAA